MEIEKQNWAVMCIEVPRGDLPPALFYRVVDDATDEVIAKCANKEIAQAIIALPYLMKLIKRLLDCMDPATNCHVVDDDVRKEVLGAFASLGVKHDD